MTALDRTTPEVFRVVLGARLCDAQVNTPEVTVSAWLAVSDARLLGMIKMHEKKKYSTIKLVTMIMVGMGPGPLARL